MIRRNRPKAPEEPPIDLSAEIRGLRRSVDTLNNHAWVRIENSLPRLLFRQVLKGLALGFGTVVGASVLVSVAVYFLAQINFVPIIGEWAAEFGTLIEAELAARNGGPGGEANEDGSIDAGGTQPAEDAPAPEE